MFDLMKQELSRFFDELGDPKDAYLRNMHQEAQNAAQVEIGPVATSQEPVGVQIGKPVFQNPQVEIGKLEFQSKYDRSNKKKNDDLRNEDQPVERVVSPVDALILSGGLAPAILKKLLPLALDFNTARDADRKLGDSVTRGPTVSPKPLEKFDSVMSQDIAKKLGLRARTREEQEEWVAGNAQDGRFVSGAQGKHGLRGGSMGYKKAGFQSDGPVQSAPGTLSREAREKTTKELPASENTGSLDEFTHSVLDYLKKSFNEKTRG